MEESRIKIRSHGKICEISSFFRQGDDATVVFVNGLGCPKETFQDVWHVTAFGKLSMLTFDLLGFGDSSKPRDYSYSLEDHVQVCQRLIERLDLWEIHLVGHSMGGAISLLLIEKAPERIASFINLEGNLIGEDCFFSRRVIDYSPEDFVQSGFERVISAMSRDTRHRELYEGLKRSDPMAFYKSSESLVGWSDSGILLSMFKSLRIKRCYVYGDANRDMPVMRLLDDIPRVEIPNSGHFMMLDNPWEFYQSLVEMIV
jgi:pimeloyl-ACP methyl ester carboxylesterase